MYHLSALGIDECMTNVHYCYYYYYSYSVRETSLKNCLRNCTARGANVFIQVNGHDQ